MHPARRSHGKTRRMPARDILTQGTFRRLPTVRNQARLWTVHFLGRGKNNGEDEPPAGDAGLRITDSYASPTQQ